MSVESPQELNLDPESWVIFVSVHVEISNYGHSSQEPVCLCLQPLTPVSAKDPPQRCNATIQPTVALTGPAILWRNKTNIIKGS